MRSIALYNRQGQRLLTLREAAEKGYGQIPALRQRIHRRSLTAYRVGQMCLVPEKALKQRQASSKATR